MKYTVDDLRESNGILADSNIEFADDIAREYAEHHFRNWFCAEQRIHSLNCDPSPFPDDSERCESCQRWTDLGETVYLDNNATPYDSQTSCTMIYSEGQHQIRLFYIRAGCPIESPFLDTEQVAEVPRAHRRTTCSSVQGLTPCATGVEYHFGLAPCPAE